ncbi:MAG: acyltransferase, partial [Opitutaceae bacterium]|nr:acyltransferase [Opitutaceae bacterium]
MIGRTLLKIRQLGNPESLPMRLLGGGLLVLSEFEARVLHPNEIAWMRHAYLRNRGVVFSKPCYFGQGFRLFRAAPLKIGPRACFGENCGLYIHADVTIDSDFLAAPGLTINNGTHDPATLQPSAVPLQIGKRVWCGVNVTLVAGAQIGDDCVIGANSLVMSPIPPRSLAVGSPARVVRSNLRP